MLTYDLSQRGDESLYEYLYLCIRADIETGVIPAGRRLPSKRSLAKHLGVSLITVEGAYAQLLAEGYAYSEERRGYFASAIDAGAAGVGARAGQRASDFGRVQGAFGAAGSAGPQGVSPAADPTASDAGSRSSSSRPVARLVAPDRTRPVLPDACPPASLRAARQAASEAGSRSQSLRPIARVAASDQPSPKPVARPAAPGHTPAPAPVAPLVANFAAGSLPPSRFPFAAWSRSVREVLSREPEAALLGETSPQGSPALREQLADYLRTFRGMRVEPGQIVVAAGSQVLYNLIVQLLGRSLGYAVETPGYPRLTSIYRANDVALSHIPLDASGLSVEALRASGAQVAHVMPSHQFPTGLVTPISRRYELLGWASERPGRYIVEDDYDCEFRLSGRPIPTLSSVDATSCVIYTNTFAKSLGSAFRMAYMVLPEALLERFHERLGFYSSTVSVTEQLALARFMASGEYERHVARTRTYYRGIRNDLVDALKSSEVSDRLEVEVTDAGLHFLMRVHAVCGEADIAASARAQGVELSPLSGYCAGMVAAPAGSPAPAGETPTFVMNYSGLTPEQIAPAVDALALALRDLPRT